MSALVGLGVRLAGAGGGARALSIGIGAAVSTVLVLLALAIPDAVYPPSEPGDAYWRANVTGAMLFALVPALVLLLTTSRISSDTRDRRLASLILLGLGRSRAAVVAMVEVGVSTLAGSAVGVVGFFLISPVADQLVAAGPAWFAVPLQTPPIRVFVVLIGLTVVAAAISATPLLRRRDVLQERSPAARRRPSRWRLAMPTVAVLGFVGQVVAGERIATWGPETTFAILVGNAVLGAVAVVVATPVLADGAAALLVRTGSMTAVLARRGIQAEPLGTSRLVAGLAVALYLVLGGQAVLLAFESTPQYRFALQTLGDGPQNLTVSGGEPDDPFSTTLAPERLAEVRAAIGAVRGVEMVAPLYDVAVGGCSDRDPDCHITAFVGTCADLASLMAVSGCQVGVAGWIAMATDEDGWQQARPPDWPDLRLELRDAQGDTEAELAIVSGPDLRQDARATEARWVYPSGVDVFLPASLVEATGAGARSLTVVAEGGTAVRADIAAALPDGTYLQPSWNDLAAAEVARVRLVVLSLSAMALGTALLGLALVTVDNARERRRTVARQLSTGVPRRLLYTGQLVQVLLPLVAAIALASPLGWLAVQAWAAVAGWPPLADGRTTALVVATIAAGGALAAVSTIPAVRVRLGPTLLRRE